MTPKERAAMQQALEALEESIALNKNWVSDSEPEILSYFSEYKAVIEQGEQVIAALREALSEQAEQEQVAVLDITYGREPECYATPNAEDLPEGIYRLYAAPVRTKDLTDKQIEKVWNKNGGYMGMPIDFARAVIAAHKEKNK